MKITISNELNQTMEKLKKKDIALFRRLQKKINLISDCDETTIHHFKNLRRGMSDYKRVHIGHFILLFRIEKGVLIFDRFVHHKEAYRKSV
ncbi:MAG: addiction module toxin RelE [Euryarchaeota archaeon]|nr:addiction module toxin RelE [Euryarchaeota archaeon]